MSSVPPVSPVLPLMSRPVLQVKGLSYHYSSAAPEVGISDITFRLPRGEFLSVVGPSGCGKSTLLACIAGFLSDYRGDIYVNGQAIDGSSPDVGIVLQEDSTFPWRTAIRNVEFGLEMQGVPRRERRERAAEMLRLMGLEGFSDYFPHQLSGGMRQRVATARTLVTHPSLLLMDEPFGALDEQMRVVCGEELLRLQMELGQTILYVTHNIQEAVMLSDNVLVMSKRPGRIKATVPVSLPRPRSIELVGSQEFAAIVGEIWALIGEDVRSVFAEGEEGKLRTSSEGSAGR